MMRRSRQRELILQAVQGTDCHPSAEWVYSKLKSDHPKLSLGTVYRNLDQLAQSGQIVRMGANTASIRFDGATHPHYHLLCSECGSLTDVDIPYQVELDEMIRNQVPTVMRHTLIFDGICDHCSAQYSNEADGKPGENGNINLEVE